MHMFVSPNFHTLQFLNFPMVPKKYNIIYFPSKSNIVILHLSPPYPEKKILQFSAPPGRRGRDNIDRWNATREKGKCQIQHTGKQINLDKIVKPARKTKDTLNLKREVRGEPVKPKKDAQCWGSRLPSGQVASRKGRSPIRIGDFQNWIKFEKIAKNGCKKQKTCRKITKQMPKKTKQMGPR